MPGYGLDLWIATWNVLSLYRAGALANLTEQLKKYKVTIATLINAHAPTEEDHVKEKFYDTLEKNI